MVHSWSIWSIFRNLRWILLLGRLPLELELYLGMLLRVCMMLGDAQLLMAPVPKWASEVGIKTGSIYILRPSLKIGLLSGHATIGGLGPTSRQWGTTLDHICEVEVVLANGTITRANEKQNPDLYFVCHVITSLVFVLYLYQFFFSLHRLSVVPEPRLVSSLNSYS